MEMLRKKVERSGQVLVILLGMLDLDWETLSQGFVSTWKGWPFSIELHAS
jgi:hypothetical protein